MTTQQIIDTLRSQLFQIKPTLPDGLCADDSFKQVWGLDSLELVEFVARIEQQFRMMIPDADLEKINSLQSTALYVSNRLND